MFRESSAFLLGQPSLGFTIDNFDKPKLSIALAVIPIFSWKVEGVTKIIVGLIFFNLLI